jgi:uroporphyrinogen-III synthase
VRGGCRSRRLPRGGDCRPGRSRAGRDWLRRLIAAPFDDLILLTGEGVYRLRDLARSAGLEPPFLAALGQTRTISRGPKPVQALRALGLQPQLRAEQPTTDRVIALLSGVDMRGRRVGVQLYPGATDNRLVEFIVDAGAVPNPATPYEYAARRPTRRSRR